MACSALPRPNNSAALTASGLVSFIWPSSAPVTSIGDMPPIWSQMYFHVQPFSRLMSRIFSVRSARFMRGSLASLVGEGVSSAMCGGAIAVPGRRPSDLFDFTHDPVRKAAAFGECALQPEILRREFAEILDPLPARRVRIGDAPLVGAAGRPAPVVRP